MNLAVILLAVIQGVTEFLPISSSAHLIIIKEMFGGITQDLNLVFDVSLHFGTVLAIIVYFFKDLYKIFINSFKGIKSKDGKLFYLLIIATIPAGIVGVLFEDIIEERVRNNLILIGFTLIVVGILIYLADKHFKNNRSIDDVKIVDAFFIGCSQILALIPGFSRSGTTLLSGRIRNINREDSLKFSFYMSIPVVLGAFILTIIKDNNISLIINNLNIFIIGVGISFITGLSCIEFLLKYLKKYDFKIFMIYRIILGIIVIIYTILK